MCVCVCCNHTCHGDGLHMEFREKFAGVGSFLPPCAS